MSLEATRASTSPRIYFRTWELLVSSCPDHAPGIFRRPHCGGTAIEKNSGYAIGNEVTTAHKAQKPPFPVAEARSAPQVHCGRSPKVEYRFVTLPAASSRVDRPRSRCEPRARSPLLFSSVEKCHRRLATSDGCEICRMASIRLVSFDATPMGRCFFVATAFSVR